MIKGENGRNHDARIEPDTHDEVLNAPMSEPRCRSGPDHETGCADHDDRCERPPSPRDEPRTGRHRFHRNGRYVWFVFQFHAFRVDRDP